MAQAVGDEGGSSFCSPRMYHIRTYPVHHASDQKCIGPKKTGTPDARRHPQYMKRYSFSFEDVVCRHVLAQGDHMEFDLRFHFELIEQNSQPGRRMFLGEVFQFTWQVPDPLNGEIRNPGNTQAMMRHQKTTA